MSSKGPQYGVERVQWPYLSGEGFLAGLPVACITLNRSAKGEQLSGDALVQAVKDALPPIEMQRPRWLAILGGDGVADNDLLVRLRTRLQMLTYFETSGLAPMCDSREKGGRLAMYDHVCVRARLPLARVRCELFHSVVACGGDNKQLKEFSVQLDKLAFNGPRFVQHRAGARGLLDEVCHSSWRFTQAVR